MDAKALRRILAMVASILRTMANNLSYSRVANWTNIHLPSHCFEDHICTPSGKSFDLPLIKHFEMCNFLVSQNIKHMHFFGDSYMRHLYVATSLALTNNYENATLSEDDAHCKYGNQFSEEILCREKILHSLVACNGRVQLSLHYCQPPNFNFCGKDELSFWSEGNHPVDWNYATRLGVNDPGEYQKKFSGDYGICPELKANVSRNCSLYWISTHARHNQRFDDEEDKKVRLYNEHMRMFFESENCGGGTGYIDVFNMTSNLIHQHHVEANFMSFDAAHWGMEVNLVKVQIVMNALKLFYLRI